MTATSTLTTLTITVFQQSKRCTMIRGIFSSIERQSLNNVLKSLIISRRITNSASVWARSMPPRPSAINEEDFTEKFLCGTGPGGQKINKTSSAVQLKHIPTGLVLKVQATRSRTQNRKIARQMLAERIEVLEKGDKSRVAVVAESKKKKKSSAVKKSKRKYRALAEAKDTDASLNIDADSEPKEP